MNIEKEVERKPQSRILLKINLDAEQVTASYQETLERYQKETQIRGFRKGKVPSAVLKNKFGKYILEESAASLMNRSLEQIWKEEKELSPLAHGELEVDTSKDFKPSETYSFAVEYDVMPNVEIPRLEEFTVEKPLLELDEEKDLQDQLQEIRQNNAVVFQSEEAVVDSNRVLLHVVNEDAEEKDILALLDEHDHYGVKEDLLGKKTDEKVVLTAEKSQSLATELGFTNPSQITLTLQRVERYELPELNDEFAQDISDDFKTLDDLKKSIKDSFKKQQESLLRSYQLRQFYRAWLEQGDVEIPRLMDKIAERRAAESLLEQGVEQREFEQKLQARLAQQDEQLSTRKAKVIEQTKVEILRGSLAKTQEITVSFEESKKELEKILASRWQRSYEEMLSLIGSEQLQTMQEQTRESLIAEKLDAYLLDNIRVIEGKEMTIEELQEELRQ